jgi:large subunit ribosomal protein L6
MSRIGKMPVMIPEGVKVSIVKQKVVVEGPLGKLSRDFVPLVKIAKEGETVVLKTAKEDNRTKALHGLSRSILYNMIEGVSKGFEKALIINGVGYRAEMRDGVLTLNLGFSNPIEYPSREGIELVVEANNRIKVRGIDKEAVGQVSAEIRGLRPPEPYKGKGIRYEDETVRRKVGKSAIGVT